jgi:hypothetical protein
VSGAGCIRGVGAWDVVPRQMHSSHWEAGACVVNVGSICPATDIPFALPRYRTAVRRARGRAEKFNVSLCISTWYSSAACCLLPGTCRTTLNGVEGLSPTVSINQDTGSVRGGSDDGSVAGNIYVTPFANRGGK